MINGLHRGGFSLPWRTPNTDGSHGQEEDHEGEAACPTCPKEERESDLQRQGNSKESSNQEGGGEKGSSQEDRGEESDEEGREEGGGGEEGSEKGGLSLRESFGEQEQENHAQEVV